MNCGRLSRSGLSGGGATSGDGLSEIPDFQRHLYEVLDTACKTLERAGIDYAVAGGLAAGYWGVPRTTSDVDLVVAVSVDQIDRVKQVFSDDPAFLFEPDDFSLADVRVVRVQQPADEAGTPSIIAIDLLVYKDGYSHDVVARRVQADYGLDSYWFCSGEDLILMKLRAGRHRDLGDIQTALDVHGHNLDLEFVTGSAELFGKRDVWNELLSEWQSQHGGNQH